MDDLFKQLLEKSGLKLFDTIEQTNYTISLIEPKPTLPPQKKTSKSA